MAYNKGRRGGNGGGKKQYDNTNRIAIFKNGDKSKQKEGAPDYRGKVNVNGKDYKVSLWLAKIENGDRAGETYMKGQIDEADGDEKGSNKGQQFEPQAAPKTGGAKQEAPAKGGDFDDDIPF